MLKKTITYKDFSGEEKSEDFYFHLSMAEMVELELSHKDGLAASLQRISDAQDGQGIVDEFKRIILSAYGERSEDGRAFTKNQEIRDKFVAIQAYSALFMELVTNTDAAIEFVNGVIPADMAEQAAKLGAIASRDLKVVEEEVKVVPAPVYVTRAEMQDMNEVELRSLGVKLSKGEVKLAE